jgi:hypothetical protein
VLLENFPVLGQISVADRIDVLRLHPSGNRVSSKHHNVGDFLTFPRRGIAPDFDIGQRSSNPRKLGRKTNDLIKF